MKILFERRGFGVQLAPGYGFGVIRRDEFDGWLADKARAAGFAFQEDTRVKGVRRVYGGVEVETSKGTLRARVVVGADGTESVVRPAVTPNKHTGVGRSLEVLTPATSPGFPSAFCGADDGYLDFRRIPDGNNGYTLTFPVLEKGVRKRSWAIWDSRATGGGPHGSLKGLLEEDMASQGYKLEDYELRGFPIRWYEPEATLATPGIVLVGDAAGVDAMVGEGISQSLAYGALAADSLKDAFDRLDFSFADYTSRVAKSPLGKNLARRTWLARNLYKVRSRPLLSALFHQAAGPMKWLMEREIFGWAR